MAKTQTVGSLMALVDLVEREERRAMNQIVVATLERHYCHDCGRAPKELEEGNRMIESSTTAICSACLEKRR